MSRIDTSGMSCPQPVLMTKNALENNIEELEIVADNNTAKNNIKRFCTSKGYKVEIENFDDKYLLKAYK
ncbi:MAG: sulfurtransferase TusA family protein [Clostridia bacterium]